jgi:hypothetical protein
MRLAFGMTGLAALSAMITAIVAPVQAGLPDPSALPDPTTIAELPATISIPVRHVTRYVTLRPGETAPAGAKVVTTPALAPQVVVTKVTVPAPAQAPRRVVVVRTKQSGG